MTEIKPLEELMDPGWAEALRPVEPQIRHMGRLLRERIGHGEHIAPASRNILRAFTIPSTPSVCSSWAKTPIPLQATQWD